LVHISELANFRVKKTEDIVKVGDEITVKCLGVDEKGRVRLIAQGRDGRPRSRKWLRSRKANLIHQARMAKAVRAFC
jgi:predicted RNA-binding protein with RPS1 domain